MPAHVKDGCGCQLRSHETLVESACLAYLCHKGIRDDLPGLIMSGVKLKGLWLECPVLIELGRKLHEIPCHTCPADILVMALAQQAMQGMSELVEHGGGLIECQKRRLTGCRLGKVADIDDNRPYILPVAVHILIAEIAHPCPATLFRTRIIVGKKYADKRAVKIRDLESLHIGIIGRDAVKLLEIQPIKPVGRLEYTFPYILHPEIRLYETLIELVVPVTHPLGIISPVPWPDYRRAVIREQTCSDIPVHDGLHVNDFLFRLSHCRPEDSVKETVYRPGIMGHLVGKYVICRGLIAEKPGFLYLKPYYIDDSAAVVMVIAVAAS